MKNILDEIWQDSEVVSSQQLIHPIGCNCQKCQMANIHANENTFDQELDFELNQARPYVLVGGQHKKAEKVIDLAKAIENALAQRKVMPKFGDKCVHATYRIFVDTLRAYGVGYKSFKYFNFPYMFSPLHKISYPRFMATWFSNSESVIWQKIPLAYRGAGAPGALYYANLLDDSKLLRIKKGWPESLKPGTFLQLWKSEEEYMKVQRTNGYKAGGHSCIVRAVEDSRTIIIADQKKTLEEPFEWGQYGFTFAIAGTPGKVSLVPAHKL